MTKTSPLIVVLALLTAGCGEFKPDGTCTRLADGAEFPAQSGMMQDWQGGWVFRDTNGISHFVGPKNSDQFKCE